MFEKYCEKNEEFVRVNWLGNDSNVFVNRHGQVFDSTSGPLVRSINHKNEYVVTADLWNGKTTYLVSMLVLVAFGKLKLPFRYFDRVEPFHIDNNKTNLHPSNIGYRYVEPIESHKYPGFYYIPFFNRYLLNREGVVLSEQLGVRISCHIVKPSPDKNRKNIKGGYFNYSLISDVGKTNIGRHRLLGLVFKPYPNHVDKLDMNHLDGIPGNDQLENLEWTTRSENNLHAVSMGLRSQNIKCFAKNVFSGEELSFDSLTSAARHLNTDASTMSGRLLIDDQRLYLGGWMFKLKEETPWRVVADPIKELQELPVGSEVLSFNIYTREVRRHSSVLACGSDLGFENNQGPKAMLRSRRFRPYNDYLFKYATDNTPWPEYTSEQLQYFRENPIGRARSVVALNDKGERMFFSNIKKASEYFKDILRSPNDVTKAINRNRNVNGWKLSYNLDTSATPATE